jgi:hypothetical protein
MKLSLIAATIATFFMSTVEAIKINHKPEQDEQPPCAEEDDQCWFDYFGIKCELDDEECVNKAFS